MTQWLPAGRRAGRRSGRCCGPEKSRGPLVGDVLASVGGLVGPLRWGSPRGNCRRSSRKLPQDPSPMMGVRPAARSRDIPTHGSPARSCSAMTVIRSFEQSAANGRVDGPEAATRQAAEGGRSAGEGTPDPHVRQVRPQRRRRTRTCRHRPRPAAASRHVHRRSGARHVSGPGTYTSMCEPMMTVRSRGRLKYSAASAAM